jgi:biopolymer transport protein ExbD
MNPRRRRHRRKYLIDEAHGFPVIPMIDVMLNLLIFFMLISNYLQPTLEVNLPEASSGVPTSSENVAITIDAEGNMALNGEAGDWDTLSSQLASFDPETQVRVSADAATSYDYIVKALDAAGTANLRHIALETRQAD